MKGKEESKKVGLQLNIQKTKILASGPIHFMANIEESVETVRDFIFLAPKSLQVVTVALKLKMLAPWKKSYDKPRQHIKKQRHYFTNKGQFTQSYGFPSSHAWV